MTTATHSLDTTSGATTVAELLARNGARAGRVPHRRSRTAATDTGEFDGKLPAFMPAQEVAPAQPFVPAQDVAPARDAAPVTRVSPLEDTIVAEYRYDKTTVAALLEDEPVAAAPVVEEETRPNRTGRKLAGIAFAGAVLVGGWALANAQTPDDQGGTAAGPVPSNNTPESNSLQASAPVGAQVVTLAASTSTSAALPPPSATTAAQQPDHGVFSGTLPPTTQQAPARSVAPAVPPRMTAPKLPSGTYTWPVNPRGYQNQPGTAERGHDQGHGHGGRHTPHH